MCVLLYSLFRFVMNLFISDINVFLNIFILFLLLYLIKNIDLSIVDDNIFMSNIFIDVIDNDHSIIDIENDLIMFFFFLNKFFICVDAILHHMLLWFIFM